MTAHSLPQPGWYRDPYAPGGLRWWDGAQWTPHARPLHAPAHAAPAPGAPTHAAPAHSVPAPAAPAPVAPTHAGPAPVAPTHAAPAPVAPTHAGPAPVAPTHAWPAPGTPAHAAPAHAVPAHAGGNERIGRLAMLSHAAVLGLGSGLFGYALARFVRGIGPFLDAVSTAPPGELPAAPPDVWLLAVASAFGTLAFVPLVLVLLWAHRCATAAAALGIPATHDPIWAVVGWFIPVLSWWFPYQSIRDCLPPEHPARPTVGWWWAAYLTLGTAAIACFLAALLSTVALAVVFAGYLAVAVATAVLGLKVVRAIDEAHREALADREQAGKVLS